MNRRKFLKYSIGSSVTVGLIGTSIWFSIDKNTQPLTINAAISLLESIQDTQILHLGEWNPSQIFNHCAQSVEYSMMGFPEHKSEIFKNTIGQLAFSAFSAKGKMTHGLNEVIPGAPELVATNNLNAALIRFKNAMIDFKNYSRKLQPHFAYGELSKQEYEKAHVMHFYNHLVELKV